MAEKNFHPLSFLAGQNLSNLFKDFYSSPQGLTNFEAEKRLQKNGLNIIDEQKERTVIWEFLAHFKSPLIIILLVATIVSACFGEIVNVIIISVMILLSVVLDFIEEHNANSAAKKLKYSVKITTAVLRNGQVGEIATARVCLGDILVLNAGDMVPADARLIEANHFYVDQSVLTGESFPCEKKAGNLFSSTESPSELSNILFMGSHVVSGTATAIVVRTGKQTEFGSIAASLVQREEKGEFETGIDKFGFFIMKVTLLLVLGLFLLNTVSRHQLLESFLFAVAIAVGVTPELLPIIMSVTMAKGSLNMLKKGVIVKKLSAIPNLGSLDVLCTDKTGTLTENCITLAKAVDVNGQENSGVLRGVYLNSFFQTGITNPLDEAVIRLHNISVAGVEKVAEVPFDFLRKKISVVVREAGQCSLITKGAPEELLPSCSAYLENNSQHPMNPEKHRICLDVYRSLSADGYRVLAVAEKQLPATCSFVGVAEENNLVFCGFAAFFDQPKKDVELVLRELKDVGITVKVLTGDNELVTTKVCQEVGMEGRGVLLGKDIENMNDDTLCLQVEKATIFARCSPIEKDRILSALRRNNHVVGYLGDGINDAPSLRRADVGISVSNAVDIAKQTADIILTSKNLEVLKDGILEGRKSFGNTMKYLLMGLSSNFGNMFSVLFAVVYVPFLPMLPVQILLNNFLYDFSQVTIPTDNVDPEWIRRPRRWDFSLIKRFMIGFGPISSFFDIATYVVLFSVFHASPGVFQTGWFIESLATQTLVIHLIRTNRLPFIQSRASLPLTITTIVAVAAGWIIPYTSVGTFFGFEPLPGKILLSIIGIIAGYLICVEIGKRIFYRKENFVAV